MATVRSYVNGFEVTDYTEEMSIIPNQWGTIGSLGIFAEEGVTQTTVTMEEVTKDGALLIDKVRGERAQVGKDYVRKIRSFAIPHFPADDYITPRDLDGRRAYGSDNQEMEAAVRARKMERIRQTHAWTLEYARAKALVTGDVYAPSGTVSQNWFTEFGQSQVTVDFVLGTGTTEILAKQESVIAQIQDNSGTGGVITGIVALCSPEFFAKLIAHATVKDAYRYYATQADILKSRAAPNGSVTAMHREFEYGGIRYIEMRDAFAGNRLIPTGECYFVPTGTDSFVTYFAPAQKFDLVGTVGEQVYMFEYPDVKGEKIEIETESNFINVVKRPQSVVKGYSS